MAKLCLITTCMGRLTHLQQTLGAAAAQPDCCCMVVDYSCPEHCGDWVEKHYPQVQVVRVPQQTRFSTARARNAGALAAQAPWLCFFDADVILSPDFSQRVLPLLQTGHFYLAQPWQRGLTGTVICPRSDFQRVGGYDEIFQGWGEEDRELYDRFQYGGLTLRGYSQELLRLLTHDDELRVQNFAVKSPQVSQTTNLLYRLAKLDLMRLLGRDLAEAERRHLYEQAKQNVQLWLANQQESQWRITFSQSPTLLGQEIVSTLVYTLNKLP